MSWQIRHEGSPTVVKGLTLGQIVAGLRDGQWEPTDEVLGPADRVWTALENHPQLAEVAAELEPPARPHREDETRLDMNALIDVCLVLLIFFILTTTYATAVQKVIPLPTLKHDSKTKARVVRVEDVKNRMIRVQALLDQAGKPVIRIENQTADVLAQDGTIHLDKLVQALRPYVRGDDRKTEILLDARGISWGMVVALQDGAKGAGIHTVHHLLRK